MLKILLVEDSDTDTLIIERAIRSHYKDAECTRIRTLTEAGSILQQHEGSPDIILLDLGLPDSEGPVNSYKKMREWAGSIPIVIMTGLNDHALAKELVLDGAEDYLSKDLILSDAPHIRDAIDFAIARHTLYQKEKDTMINCFMGGYSITK